jgi:SET domain-containing protein
LVEKKTFMHRTTVQNPVSKFVEARTSATHGLGLFAKSFIPSGTIWWSAGPSDLIHVNQANFKTLAASVQSPEVEALVKTLLHYSYYVKEFDALLFIPDNGRLVNHSFEPNSKTVPDRLSSVTVRDIAAGEELFEDYTHYDKCPWAQPYGEFGRKIGCWGA